MQIENKIIYQSICSFIISIVLPIMSLLVPNKHITNILDVTWSPAEWKTLGKGFSKKISTTATKAVTGYLEFIGSVQSKTGIDDKETDLTAKASEKVQKDSPLWQIPLEGKITSSFGERVHPVSGEKTHHNGLDIAATKGDTVVCAADGTVTETGKDEANGNFVVVEHTDSLSTIYAHLDNISVEKDTKISRGQKIGEAGSTGTSTGPHLHFEIKLHGKSVDPFDYISGWHN